MCPIYTGKQNKVTSRRATPEKANQLCVQRTLYAYESRTPALLLIAALQVRLTDATLSSTCTEPLLAR